MALLNDFDFAGRECQRFCRSGMRVCVVYGGTSISEQIAELKRGAEVIVCTPGRMIDMLAANSGRVGGLLSSMKCQK